MADVARLAKFWRLAPLVAGLTAVVLLATGIVIVYSGERAFRAQKIDQTEAEARILAATLAGALTFDDRQAAQTYAHALAANPEIEAAAVYDAAGATFAAYQLPNAAVPPTAPPAGVTVAGDRIGVATEVSQNGAVLGSVYIRTVLEPLSRRLERYAIIGLLVVVTALVTAALGVAQSALARSNRELAEANFSLEGEIAQRENAEAALRQAQKMEAIGQLTGGVAHDFNNLLQVILGNLGTVERALLREGSTSPATLLRPVRSALQVSERAAVLVRQLLAFSRRQPLEPKPLDANRLIVGMSDLLHRTLSESIEVETVLGAGLWQTLADANQVESAILNLIVNARDAMPAGGRLTIETANAFLDEIYAAGEEDLQPGQYVVIAVTDTGTGMSADVVRKAFDPFFTTKDVGRGTGLGLSQIYGFIKQSGGHAKIYSEVGQGTTVKLYLPRLLSAAVDAEAPSVVEPLSSRGRREVILVVEDEAGVRNFVVEMLRELDYDVVEAGDGNAALAAVESRPDIDLLFTDVGLPGGLNGRQLANEARQRLPKLKVLFTTGYARNAIVHQGRLDPGVELISKPFSYAALAARVRQVLDLDATA